MSDDLLARLGFSRPPFMADALCREYPGIDWYNARQADEAKAVCRRCLVREECLEHALAADERHGAWGGASEAERRALRRPAA